MKVQNLLFRFISIFLLVGLQLGLFDLSAQSAELRLPSIIGDHMVLQANQNVPIWGWASPNEVVTVQFQGQEKKVKVNNKGKWKVELEPMNNGGPYLMEIRSDQDTIKVVDILIGEVWLASGQSNMAWPMNRVENAERHIEVAYYPQIRFFTVKKNYSNDLLDDCEGEWVKCNPMTTDPFSGVAYFFARAIHDKIKTPVGMIHSSWGGTPAESWTSQKTIDANKDFQTLQDNLKRDLEKYQRDKPAFDRTIRTSILKPALADINGLSGIWNILSGIEGEQVQTSMEISIEHKIPHIQMEGAKKTSEDIHFENGKLNWTYQNTSMEKLSIEGIVRGNSFKGTAMKSNGEQWPVKALKASSNSESIRLTPPDELRTSASLYNAMIYPLAPFAIKGAIWYQGESNAPRAHVYRTLFPAMIKDWRNLWGQGEFPFYYTQIAPFNYREKDIGVELREAQLMALRTKNTGMAVTSDIATIDDIHPPNKLDVGVRLALWALHNQYGQDTLTFSGPLYLSHEVRGDKIEISFDHVGEGLVILGDELTHFTIAGKDRTFVKANAKIVNDKVIVWSSEIKKPVAVRFGWSNSAEPNLFNDVGLPASSFRTDDWPGVTKD